MKKPCYWCDDLPTKAEPAYGYDKVHISMYGTYICANAKKIKKKVKS